MIHLTHPASRSARRRRAICALMLASAGLGSVAWAQNGDRAGETQRDLPADLRVPPAPALAPADEQRTFALPPGFRIELVASEPLIEAPVQAVFDEDGRLWVVEMRGYMRDPDARGEREPTGRISVLTDADGDGRMDASVVFLDHLVLPRAVAPTRGGALVIAPPKVLFCRDTDGDGAADEQVVVDSGIGGIESPEYGPNGLLPTLDNAFQCANHDLRYRFAGNQWTKQRTGGGGQWGITQDDLGRIYQCFNTHFLRGDLVPSQYLARNPNVDAGPLVNAEIAADQLTFPARITPGVNRAYKDGWLADWKLKRADAACGPHVYRGGAFPGEYDGNAFVCEPAGNLVKRLRLEDKPPFGRVARGAWPDRDFLTSTDERFRPVNLASGPDGALYVVDMYRGILQHRLFLTTFLRKQIEARGLAEPCDRGRIWRVVHEGSKRAAPGPLSKLASADLARLLESPNGWIRDTAQRLFVEGAWDEAVVAPRLRDVVATSKSALARIHALWALSGSRLLDAATATKALQDRSNDVRAAALRASEPLVASGKGPEIQYALALATSSDPRLRWTAFATLSGAIDHGVLANMILRNASSAEDRRAVVSGIAANQLLFLNATLLALSNAMQANWDGSNGREEFVRLLASCVAREGQAGDVETLISGFLPRPNVADWQRVAIVDGLLDGRGKGPKGEPGRIRLAAEPRGYLLWMGGADEALRSKGEELLDALRWPGRADVPAEEVPRALAAEEQQSFERGRAVFASVCQACHQSSGRGDPGIAPPLRGVEFALGDPVRAATIVIAGLEGPLVVDGRAYDLSMPSWNGTDREIADVLTYVRREWGHGADPVTLSDAARAREMARARGTPLRAEDLKDWRRLAAAPAPIALANGRDLAGWRPIGDALWSVEDGAIRGKRGGGAQSFLATERGFGDFELDVDVRVIGTGNSGIQIRSRQDETGRVVGCQVEIDPSDRAWSGGIYDEGRRGWLQDLSKNPAARSAFRKGEWNHYRIVCDGSRIQVSVNGVATAEIDDAPDARGFVALQVHSGQDTDVLWRDLRLVERALNR